jgi:hypothetical protein
MYDAFGLDWSGLGSSSSSTTALHSRAADDHSKLQSLPESRGFNKESKAKQVSKRTRVHVCVLRSSTFLVCTEYLHEKERKKECQFLLQGHQKKKKKARVS